MSPGQREEMTGSITEGNVFVPASQRPKVDTSILDMTDLDRERDDIMAPTHARNKELENNEAGTYTLKGTNKDWRAIGLAAARKRRTTH